MPGRCYFNRRCVSKQHATRSLAGPRSIADDVLLVRCAHRHGGARWQASRRIRAPALCANSHLSKQQAEALHRSRSRSRAELELHRALLPPRLQQPTPPLLLACHRRGKPAFTSAAPTVFANSLCRARRKRHLATQHRPSPRNPPPTTHTRLPPLIDPGPRRLHACTLASVAVFLNSTSPGRGPRHCRSANHVAAALSA